MTQSSQDIFYQFIDEYEQGNIVHAFRLILNHPDSPYDPLEPFCHYIANYVDACVFKGALQAYITNQALQRVLGEDKRLSILCDSFLQQLKKEEVLIECYSSDKEDLAKATHLPEELKLAFIRFPEDIDPILEMLPAFMQEKWHILKIWQEFKKAKPEFCQLIEETRPIEALQPWHSFSYSLPLEELQIVEKTPLLFLEPIENFDYQHLLALYSNRPIVFAFETVQHFLQMLQFPDVVASFMDPQHFIYIFSLYPNTQFKAQSTWKASIHQLEPIFLIKRKIVEEYIPLFTQILTECLEQPKEKFEEDTPIANWLYQLTKRMLFNIQTNRYGESRQIAANIERSYQDWYDSHKGAMPPQANRGPPVEDTLGKKINDLNAQRQPRLFAPKEKVRIAHVVPQVVDGGHAPTKLLKNLLTYSDCTWFTHLLVSTERMVEHPFEYPIGDYFSVSSNYRGWQTLYSLYQRGVKISVEDQPLTYEETIQHVTEILKKFEIDIVVFHGPDEINSLCSAMTDVPIRVLFEHGTLPNDPCFDLLVLSTEDAFRKHQERYRALGVESCFLNFAVDVKEGWELKPYPKEDLGLPSNSFVMTTISNHLDNRLSTGMCQAIGEILQRCPQAYYAPIGKVNHPERLRAIFDQYEVNNRVVFLGNKPNPSQYARSMELYLNEFPFGSGLGMLDAMAAGCPVVSMYDEHGPQQARYGATYFGIDRVIKSGRKEDYVELACRLIQDHDFYQEWSRHAREQYEKRVDTKAYVKAFERVLEVYIDRMRDKRTKDHKR